MRMRRHGVPDASGSEPCKPHHQLATPGSLQVNEFRYLPQIRGFSGAERNLCLFGSSHELSRMRRVSRITQQIELRRVGRFCAGEYNLVIAPANIESIEVPQLKRNTVDFDHPSTADIQNPELPTLGEV